MSSKFALNKDLNAKVCSLEEFGRIVADKNVHFSNGNYAVGLKHRSRVIVN